MSVLIYELRVPTTGEVVRTETRKQSLAALRELRARLGPLAEVRLEIRRPEAPEDKGQSR
jgi:hypothetical protein